MSASLERPAAPRLTVALLSYNGRTLLETSLPSLARQSFRDFELVVVDNGSSDDTVAWLGEHWPQVQLIALPQNVGVTAALNVCAQAGTGELVGLFNNDVELDPECLGELVMALDRHPQAGSAVAKLLDFYRRDVLDGAGDLLLWSGSGHRRGYGERDIGQYEEPRAIFGACGAAAVYRRSAFAVVGTFDEDFAAFFEDIDWALRAQLAGFECRYVPSAVVYHMGSATLGAGLTDYTRYQLSRNGVWVLVKGMPASLALRHSHQLLLGQLINLAVALRDRKLNIWLRAWRDGLRGLPRMLRRRREIQRARRISPRELEPWIGSGG